MTDDELSRLRRVAQSLLAEGSRRREETLARWTSSERPALKAQAASLKASEALLLRTVEGLEARIAARARTDLSGRPGAANATNAAVFSGFNPIQSRAGPDGAPLPIPALAAERDRLLALVSRLEADAAECRAEVLAASPRRRAAEAAVWETRLVALADTLRVLRSEISAVEVELAGREAAEALVEARRAAEASGAAALHRARADATAARVAYNRAKRRQYFPDLRGYNITFGGGGVYGACKDICISEIRGTAVVEARPPSVPGGPATLVLEGHAPRPKPVPRRSSNDRQDNNGAGRSAAGAGSEASSGRRAGTGPPEGASTQAARGPPGTAHNPREELEPKPGASTFAALPSEHRPSASAGTDGSPGGSTKTPPSHGFFPPQVSLPGGSGAGPGAAGSGPQAPLPPIPPKASKSKMMALKFMARIGSKKEKYKGSDSAELELRHDSTPPKKSMKSLASKLLGRKSKGAAGPDSLSRASPGPSLYHDSLDARSSVADDLSQALDAEEEEGEAAGGLARPSTGGGLARPSVASAPGRRLETLAEALAEGGGDLDALRALGGVGAPGGAGGGGVEDYDEEEEEGGEGDGSLASTPSGSGSELDRRVGLGDTAAHPAAPLTAEVLFAAARDAAGEDRSAVALDASTSRRPPVLAQGPRTASSPAPSPRRRTHSTNSLGRGGWLKNAGARAARDDDGSASDDERGGGDVGEGGGTHAPGTAPPGTRGVFVRGRTSGFELVGEKGSKVPNLSIGQADVEANVFVRLSFKFTEAEGWQPGDERPLFDVQHLEHRLVGNSVPMPASLIRAILKTAIPGLIQRRLQLVLPRELGSYLLRAGTGVALTAGVDCVGPALATLDADLAFEVRGPARSAREAQRQQRRLAAAREARRLLGLTLPSAQALSRLWAALIVAGGGGLAAAAAGTGGAGWPAAVPPHAAHHLSIAGLVAFVASQERCPQVYDQLCGVLSAGWAALARAEPALGPLDVRAFLDGPLAAVRRKPARLRVALSSLDAAFNLDAAIAAAHAYTRRALEELFVNGPLPNASEGGGDGATKEAMDEQFELLQAWHAWVSREVGHFKSKFRGAAATVLGAANCRGFTLGVENGEYEGPLKLHLPVNMELDPDGAFSFDAPLPSPTGKIGEFMDIFKALTVPSHLRPPAAAVNWVPLSGDPALDMAMREQVACGVALIAKVLDRLGEAAQREGRPGKEESAATALTNPRTLLGASLGRFIVNRLSLRVRLDERRIAEILEGMDSSTLGDQFVPTAGRILGHLGDVVSFRFCPATLAAGRAGAGSAARPTAYLLQAESSDISRLRAEVQSLGYQSAISPAGAVRLVHAVGRAFLASFKQGVQEGALAAYTARMERLYALFSREGLDLSVCCSVRAGVEAGDAVARLRGRADEVALRETSPLLLTMDVDLVALGRAMRGDP
ncbi:hypothetical protein ACKKBG_A01350 [Auxenochlorella protothecoides x Auxenochlorella symbiontica]